MAHADSVPLAVYLLRNYIGPCRPRSSNPRRWTGPITTIFWRLVVPLGPGARRVRNLPVPLGGTTCWWRTCSWVARAEPSPHGGLRGCGRTRGELHLLTAAAFISMALPLIVFFSLQKYCARAHGRLGRAECDARRRRRSPAAGVARCRLGKVAAILLATLVLAPAFWAIIFGMVSAASDAAEAPAAARTSRSVWR